MESIVGDNFTEPGFHKTKDRRICNGLICYFEEKQPFHFLGQCAKTYQVNRWERSLKMPLSEYAIVLCFFVGCPLDRCAMQYGKRSLHDSIVCSSIDCKVINETELQMM